MSKARPLMQLRLDLVPVDPGGLMVIAAPTGGTRVERSLAEMEDAERLTHAFLIEYRIARIESHRGYQGFMCGDSKQARTLYEVGPIRRSGRKERWADLYGLDDGKSVLFGYILLRERGAIVVDESKWQLRITVAGRETPSLEELRDSQIRLVGVGGLSALRAACCWRTVERVSAKSVEQWINSAASLAMAPLKPGEANLRLAWDRLMLAEEELRRLGPSAEERALLQARILTVQARVSRCKGKRAAARTDLESARVALESAGPTDAAAALFAENAIEVAAVERLGTVEQRRAARRLLRDAIRRVRTNLEGSTRVLWDMALRVRLLAIYAEPARTVSGMRSEVVLKRFIELLRDIVREPQECDSSSVEYELSVGCYELGWLWMAMTRGQALDANAATYARAAFERSAGIRERLLEQFPGTWARRELSMPKQLLARLCVDQSPDEALAIADECDALLQCRDNLNCLCARGRYVNNAIRVDLLERAGRVDEAVELCREIRADQEPAYRDDPTDEFAKESLEYPAEEGTRLCHKHKHPAMDGFRAGLVDLLADEKLRNDIEPETALLGAQYLRDNPDAARPLVTQAELVRLACKKIQNPSVQKEKSEYWSGEIERLFKELGHRCPAHRY